MEVDFKSDRPEIESHVNLCIQRRIDEDFVKRSETVNILLCQIEEFLGQIKNGKWENVDLLSKALRETGVSNIPTLVREQILICISNKLLECELYEGFAMSLLQCAILFSADPQSSLLFKNHPQLSEKLLIIALNGSKMASFYSITIISHLLKNQTWPLDTDVLYQPLLTILDTNNNIDISSSVLYSLSLLLSTGKNVQSIVNIILTKLSSSPRITIRCLHGLLQAIKQNDKIIKDIPISAFITTVAPLIKSSNLSSQFIIDYSIQILVYLVPYTKLSDIDVLISTDILSELIVNRNLLQNISLDEWDTSSYLIDLIGALISIKDETILSHLLSIDIFRRIQESLEVAPIRTRENASYMILSTLKFLPSTIVESTQMHEILVSIGDHIGSLDQESLDKWRSCVVSLVENMPEYAPIIESTDLSDLFSII